MTTEVKPDGPLAQQFAQVREARAWIEAGIIEAPEDSQTYAAAKELLPQFDASLSAIERHVQELTEQRDAALARYESYKPGTMEGQVHAIWDLAEHYGHPAFSSKHPVGFLTRFIDDLQRHVQDMETTQRQLDDDEAVMRGFSAVRRMLQLRVGDRKAHAAAFRVALSGAPTGANADQEKGTE